MFQSYGFVKRIEKDWVPYDCKEKAKKCLKTATQLHFKISHCRRIIVMKRRSGKKLVKGYNFDNLELGYNLDTARERSVCNVGKTFEDVNTWPVPLGVKV